MRSVYKYRGVLYKVVIFLQRLLYPLNLIFIRKSGHIAFSNNWTYRPATYRTTSRSFLSNRQHLINALPYGNPPHSNEPLKLKSGIKYILEYENILMCTNSTSYNYELMIERVSEVAAKLEDEDCVQLIALSEKAKQHAFSFHKSSIIDNKTTVLYPSVVLQEKFPLIESGKKFVLLHIGNKYHGKGTEIFIRIANRFLGDATFEFILVSNDVPYDRRVPDNVILLRQSRLNEVEKKYLYSRSNLLVFPIFQDSFGVYLEAISYQIPIITNNIYDKSEIVINEKTGYLIESPLSLWDGKVGVNYKNWNDFKVLVEDYLLSESAERMVEEYEHKIREIASDRELYDYLSNNTKELCLDRFSVRKRADALRLLYRKLL